MIIDSQEVNPKTLFAKAKATQELRGYMGKNKNEEVRKILADYDVLRLTGEGIVEEICQLFEPGFSGRLEELSKEELVIESHRLVDYPYKEPKPRLT